MKTLIIVCVLFFIPTSVLAVEYQCLATVGMDSSGKLWSKDRLEKWRPGVIIKHYPKASNRQSTISRCSYSMIEGKRTCDTYPIDHYERAAVAVDLMFIDKFYNFQSQVDVQIYITTGNKISKYIENNGRGTFYEGNCVESNS